MNHLPSKDTEAQCSGRSPGSSDLQLAFPWHLRHHSDFYVEDRILRHAGSELQLRGSFCFISMNSLYRDVQNSLFIPMHDVHRDTKTEYEKRTNYVDVNVGNLK
jgi:hypothetical protein